MFRTMPARLGGVFRARRRDQELDDEIRAHLDMLAARFLGQGMVPADAFDAAKRQFGGVTQMKEVIRERRGIPVIEEFIQDGRFALRQFRKAFGFTAVAVSVLALGVGANTAIFSMINAVLLRPLPYREADRLAWIGETLKRNSTDQVTLTPDFLEWRDHNTAFTGMAAFNLLTRTLTNIGTHCNSAQLKPLPLCFRF